MLFKSFGPLELVIVLALVILLFGIGRISKIGGELGGAIRSFRKGLKGDEKEEEKDDSTQE